jgi:hypothetical protein
MTTNLSLLPTTRKQLSHTDKAVALYRMAKANMRSNDGNLRKLSADAWTQYQNMVEDYGQGLHQLVLTEIEKEG